MILARYLLTLLGIIALQSTGRANPIKANDEQTCTDLCTKCDGVAVFVDNACECHVADDNQRGAECIGRIKRQAEELGLDIVSCDLADPDADRAARCVLSPFRRFKSRSDADLIANYFMGGLESLGGLLGSSKSKADGSTPDTETTSDSSPTAENVNGNGNELDSDSSLLGAPNPLNGLNPISSQLMGTNPLLGAAAAWLNPQTLFAIGSGMQGLGGHNFVGQPNPSSMSGPTNFVGSSHQGTGNPPSMGMHESYGTYPPGAISSMAPYQYFVGTPNPAQSHDGLAMQPYVYAYNSMVAAQNPSFVGDSAGLSPYWRYPTPLVQTNNAQPTDSAAGLESSVDESAKEAKEPLSEPDSDPSVGAEKDTDLQDVTDESDTIANVIEEPVVKSKQTDQAPEGDAANPEEIKDQPRRTANHSTKRKQNRFRS